MKKILILEPHPDDCLLSCHFFLSNLACKGFKFEVITFDSFNGRIGDLYFYDNFETRILKSNLIKHSCPYDRKLVLESKKVKASKRMFLFQEYMSKYRDNAFEVENALHLIEQNDYSFILCPLGLAHAMHIFVAEIARSKFDISKFLFFRDTPYGFKQYGKLLIEEYLQDNFKEAIKVELTIEELAIRKSLLKKYYPSEIGLMHPLYEMPNFERENFELIYTKGGRDVRELE